MGDAPNTYKSTLTPQEVDAALKNIGKVEASVAAAAASAEQSKAYADSINPANFATAAQGLLASNAMPSIWAASTAILNQEGQNIDLLNIFPSDASRDQNKPYFFGSDTPGSQITNAPYSSGPFYGLRQVLFGKRPDGSTHLVTVLLFETYPTAGRIWGNSYDTGSSQWYGWHSTN